ncbi:HTTM domain-containing protein [Tautonia plasticadhaerens]|nr:HTTM domain-containing protein [Tautonia plasticadhaerens]
METHRDVDDRPSPGAVAERSPSTGSRTTRTATAKAGRLLFGPVDVAALVYFRVVFGLVMLWEVAGFLRFGWVRQLFLDPIYLFTYPGFGWVRPWPEKWMHLHFYGMGLAAAMIAAGLYYRLASVLFFLGFSYVFLLDQCLYQNHFYLIVLLSGLMPLLPANRDFSADVRMLPWIRRRWVPAWTLGILRAQLGLVYFFGGVAKLNGDWLRGEPMRSWLAIHAGAPVVGPWLSERWVVLGFSYGGLLLDLLAAPMLLWGRTRAFAALVLLAFHLTNAALFEIGIFPWFMILATPIFFPSTSLRPLFGGRREPAPDELPDVPSRRSRRVMAALIGLYLGLQVLIPLRHHLYPGDVNWTEEGHRFSWHMKLRDKSGDIRFVVTDPGTGRSAVVNPADFLSPRQEAKMAIRPHMIRQFAHYLADFYGEAGVPGVEVRALAVASLNGRPPQKLVDDRVDLAAQPRAIGPAPWIVPLEGGPIPIGGGQR